MEKKWTFFTQNIINAELENSSVNKHDCTSICDQFNRDDELLYFGNHPRPYLRYEISVQSGN